jgi:hypothetical protein
MPDYQNSKIYKIVCGVTGLQYIGTTTKTTLQFGDKIIPALDMVLRKYKSLYKKYYENDLYGSNLASFKVLENNSASIELIEDYPCQTKEELFKRERHHIESRDCVNQRGAGKKKYVCNCGGHYSTETKTRHLNTIKHNEYLKTIKTI